MLICDHITLEPWTTDFSSSGQPNRRWTRVSAAGVELTNSLEDAEWEEACVQRELDESSQAAVQVILCEECGVQHCAPGGWVQISKLGSVTLWSAPQIDMLARTDTAEYAPPAAIRKHGALAFPEVEWGRLCAASKAVPPSSEFPAATGRIIGDAWLHSAPGRGWDLALQAAALGTVLAKLAEQCVGTDRLSTAETVALLEPLIAQLEDARERPLRGAICKASALRAQVETLFFDGPREHDWPAFALLGEAPILALSGNLVFVPESLDPNPLGTIA